MVTTRGGKAGAGCGRYLLLVALLARALLFDFFPAHKKGWVRGTDIVSKWTWSSSAVGGGGDGGGGFTVNMSCRRGARTDGSGVCG